ncbi:hypothetical protein O988_02967 [Pseudogymnoascus sp. VKM F-3808]|nr:hypothetical protein O988_02967 [Pseudogymnoascus sp. VKM F-3808]
MAGFPNLAELMGGDIVTVYVGPREKRYSVHKALLTSQSEYFEKALNGKFKEADEQTIRLPEDSPDAFNLLIGWLYQNQIPVLGYGPGPFDAFPRGLVVGATKLGNSILPPNLGTGNVAYRPHEEPSANIFVMPPGDNNPRDRFNHICTQPEYDLFSSDELRLEDYARNHRFSDFSQPSPEHVVTPDSFPVSSGRVDGIPWSPPIEPIMAAEEAHQLALIRLCLFAETICWTSLFNIAMSTYIQGESFLAPRPMPSEHIELIYERAHPESPCRKFAADATISQINGAGQIDRNMDLVEQWPSFLEDIFKRLRLSQDLSLTHRPKYRARCEYHVHDTKNRPENCSAASESQKFMLDGRAPAKSTFIASPQSQRFTSGAVDPDNTRSGDDSTTVGSAGEIRYTTYLPNTGYTTRTLGYDETTGAPSFGRTGDSMDWGTAYKPWLKGGGFGQTPTPLFGTTGFGSTAEPLGAPPFGVPSFGAPRAGFGTGPLFGSAAATTSTNPTATAASSSSSQDTGLGSTGTDISSPQATAATPSPAAAATPSPAPAVSASGLSEAGASNTTPQKGAGDVTVSKSPVPDPVFGKVSPLTSPLPSITARSISPHGIFGQRQTSTSSRAGPGSSFLSAQVAAAGFTPPPSSSTSSTDASGASPQSTSTASTSPFGLLGARSSPAPSSFPVFGYSVRSPAGMPEKHKPSGFESRGESNAAPNPVPSNVRIHFGSTSGPSAESGPAISSSSLFGSTAGPSAASGPAVSSPSLFGSIARTSAASGSAISSSSLFGSTGESPNTTSTTAPPHVGLFGSTSGASSASVPTKPLSSSPFGLKRESNDLPPNGQ